MRDRQAGEGGRDGGKGGREGGREGRRTYHRVDLVNQVLHADEAELA